MSKIRETDPLSLSLTKKHLKIKEIGKYHTIIFTIYLQAQTHDIN